MKSLITTLLLAITLSLSVYGDATESSLLNLCIDDRLDIEFASREIACRQYAERRDTPSAYHMLASKLYFGKSLTQNYIEAAKYYRLAAEQGLSDAQFDIGLMYATGKGVPQDDVIAYMWWNLASAKGHESAYTNKKILSKEMTSSQIAEAQKLSRECLKKEYKSCY